MGAHDVDLIVGCPLVRELRPVRFQADGRDVVYKPRKWEILIWISIAKRDPHRNKHGAGLPLDAVIFPALLDTGCPESLIIHEWHLEHWLALPLNSFEQTGPPKILMRNQCPMISVDLWLHWPEHGPFKPPTAKDRAIKLQMSGGALASVVRTSSCFPIGKPKEKKKKGPLSFLRRQPSEVELELVEVWAASAAGHRADDIPFDVYPTLPLLGLKTLHTNRLDLHINGHDGVFSLRRRR